MDERVIDDDVDSKYSSRTRVEREPWSGTQGSWGSDTKSVALFAHDGLVVAPQLCDKWLWKEMCVTVRAIKRREREREEREKEKRERREKREQEREREEGE
jgi:hypothetical protein